MLENTVTLLKMDSLLSLRTLGMNFPLSRINPLSLHMLSRGKEVLSLTTPEELLFLELCWKLSGEFSWNRLIFGWKRSMLEGKAPFPFIGFKTG